MLLLGVALRENEDPRETWPGRGKLPECEHCGQLVLKEDGHLVHFPGRPCPGSRPGPTEHDPPPPVRIVIVSDCSWIAFGQRVCRSFGSRGAPRGTACAGRGHRVRRAPVWVYWALDLATDVPGTLFDTSNPRRQTKAVRIETLRDKLGPPFFAHDLALNVKNIWAEWAAAQTQRQ